jgi:hypothetical protein
VASLAQPQARLHHRAAVALAALITLEAVGAALALAFTAPGLSNALHDHFGWMIVLLASTLLLQLAAVHLPGHGTISVSAVGVLAAAIQLGTGAAIVIAVAAALTQWVRARGLAHRALFDASTFALSAAAAALTYHATASASTSSSIRLLAALLAGLAYTTVNHSLLCLAISLSETRSPLKVWQKRFHWARHHFLAYGLLGLVAAITNQQLGFASLPVLLLPPILLAQTMRIRFEQHRDTPRLG